MICMYVTLQIAKLCRELDWYTISKRKTKGQHYHGEYFSDMAELMDLDARLCALPCVSRVHNNNVEIFFQNKNMHRKL